MKILDFGSCNLDFIYKVENIVLPGETVACKEVETHSGGKGLNQAVALAKAGVDVYFAGCIGSDGQGLKQLLSDSGADVSLIKTCSLPNGQAFIQVAGSGQNSIIIYHGANYCITKEYVDEVLSHFSEGDFILLQNEINETDYIIQKSYEKGMKIILNPSPFDENMSKTDYSKIYLIFVNEVEAAEICKSDEKEHFISYVKENYPDLKVVLTLGKNGSVYFDKEKCVSQDIFKVKAVDTTAAGDTFTGFFMSGYMNGDSVEKCLKTASAASAIAVSRKGAAPSVPTLDEVNDFLSKQ